MHFGKIFYQSTFVGLLGIMLKKIFVDTE